MGVSFKVARMGTRYRPKPIQISDDDNAEPKESLEEGDSKDIGEKVSDISNALAKPRQHTNPNDIEVSFSLNLFQNGFSFGEDSELLNRAPEQLFPYKDSMTLFSAIEYGCLPGDALDDLPFKYVNGSVLCQIRDYRNCLFLEGGIRSTRSSPIVHKVTLRMCMENVVKDILSISDDSWTYENLLEFESLVLKALQPVLNLNPQPLQKKVDLEISYSWKKRDQPNEPVTNPVLNNLYQATDTPRNSAGQKSNFQSHLVRQDPGVTLVKENVATQIHSQENNIVQEKNSGSLLLTSQPSRNSWEIRDVPALAEPNTPCVSVAKQNPSSLTGDQAKRSSSDIRVKVRRQKRTPGGSARKVKKEPIGWSSEQAPEKTPVISHPPHQLQWNNSQSDQRSEAEKTHREGLLDKLLSRHANREFISNSLARSTTCAVKPEPLEICYRSSDNFLFRDKVVGPSNGVSSQIQQALPLVKSNNPLTRNPTVQGLPLSNTLTYRTNQMTDNYSRTTSVASKRKTPETPLSICDESAQTSSRNIPTLQGKAFAPPRQNVVAHHLERFGVADQSIGTANAKRLPERNNLLYRPSGVSDGAVLERLQKIGDVTRRHQPTKKPKLDHEMRNQPFSLQTSEVALHLSNFAGNAMTEETASDRKSLSKIPITNSNVIYVRTLIFVCKQVSPDPGECNESRVRLVLEKKPNSETVEANALYGYEDKTDSSIASLLPSFHTSHSADLFASQFTSLMAREGYELATDQVKPKLPKLTNPPSHQHPNHPANQPPARPSFAPSPLPRLAAADGDAWPLGPFSAGEELSQQMREIMIRRAQVQHQLQQRLRQQEILMQRAGMMGSAAGLGPGSFHRVPGTYSSHTSGENADMTSLLGMMLGWPGPAQSVSGPVDPAELRRFVRQPRNDERSRGR